MILSERTQASIIASLLRGDTIDVDPQDLTGDWRDYYAWIQAIRTNSPDGIYEQFLVVFSQENETQFSHCKLIGELRDQPLDYPAVDRTLDELPDLRWLWHGWIARGQITILMGDPSAGKSYLTLDLARRIAAGTAFPDGTPVERPGSVLYVDAENRPSILKMRVQTWNDLERARLFYMLPAPNRMMIDLDHNLDVERLLDRVYRIRPELIIIDSYSSISLKGENNKEDVQRILSFLTRVARDYDCAVVIIHHQRKKARLQLTLPNMPELSIHNLRGSGHIGAMATNILGLQLVGSDKNGTRSLHIVKNNIGTYPDPIGVVFAPWDEDPEIAVITYGDVPEPDREMTKVEQCAEWLIEVLEEMGPLPSDEIVDMAEDEGFNRRMVYRARKRLEEDITDTKGRNYADNRWSLVEENAETDNDAA